MKNLIRSPRIGIFTISIIGPKQTGKTTLMRSIITHYTKRKQLSVTNMISILSSEGERIFFIENIADTFSFVHSLNFSELVILLIDGFFGVELETFETITLVKNSNLKRYIFILTHLDLFKTWKSLKKAKKRIKDRLNKETEGNCKIFYFSGIREDNIYFFGEIKNLTRYLNRVKLSYLNSFQGISNYAIITRMDFNENIHPNIGFFSGYFKKNICPKRHENCFIPGVGKIVVLRIKKSSIESEKKVSSFSRKKHEVRLSFTDYTKSIFEDKRKNLIFVQIKYLLLFSLSFGVRFKKKKKTPNILLVDSNKMFDLPLILDQKLNTDILFSIFERIYFRRYKKGRFTKIQKLYPFSKNFKISKQNDKKQQQLKVEKYHFELKGFPSEFKKNYDSHFLITIIFQNKNETKEVVAKIFKNKWINESLFSGKYYILSVGFKLIIARLYFCNQKKKNNFNIIKKIKAIDFFYICFNIDLTSKNDLIIGLKKKSQIRNARNQGASFSILFFGEIFFIKNIFKMFKKLKLKGCLVQKYKKTAFIKGMFNSNIEAIKYEGASIKTLNGIKGVIKNIQSKDPKGLFRATFEKNIKNENFVSITTFLEVKIDKNFKEIFLQLVPFDYRDLL